MAKKRKKYPTLLENLKGVIIVKEKVGFELNSMEPCSNCQNPSGPRSVYNLINCEQVHICYHCNESKIHNVSSANPRFRKDEILNIEGGDND